MVAESNQDFDAKHFCILYIFATTLILSFIISLNLQTCILLTKLHSAQGVFLATYQHGHKQKKKKISVN